MKKTVRLIVSFENDFIPFLKNNTAYNDYIGSVLEHHRGENYNESLQDLIYRKLQDVSPWLWISGMFSWIESNQCVAFWSKINTRWHEFLQNEVGIEDCEIVGEVSKSYVEKLFSLEYLRGRYYRVADLSYNRPVTNEWDCKKWKLCDPSVELHKPGGVYLILSDYPEDKIMLWHGSDGSWTPRPMIKVWIPELDRAQWVFYEKRNLQNTK